MKRLVRAIDFAALVAFAICSAGAQDTTPPTIVKSGPDALFAAVIVEFSEAVSDTALDTANYALTNSALNQAVSISAATRISDNKVKLTTGLMPEATMHTLTVNNVQDT